MSVSITRGLVDPLASLGFPVSAGVQLDDGSLLYAIFDARRRRVMIVARPSAQGDMPAVALAPWTAEGEPRAGDLLDELIDPRNIEAVRLALRLKRDGSL
jgi:hypothetical protein